MIGRKLKNVVKRSEILTHAYKVHTKAYLRDTDLRTLKYLYHRGVTAQNYQQFVPSKYSSRGDIEVHMLLSNDSYQYGIWAIISVLRHTDLKPFFVIHSDGSVSHEQASELETLIGPDQVKVLSRSEADHRVNELLGKCPNIRAARLSPDPFPLLHKLIDVILLDEIDPVLKIYIDSDILFFEQANELSRESLWDTLIRDKRILLSKQPAPNETAFAASFFEGWDGPEQLYGNSGVVGFHPQSIDMELLEKYFATVDGESWFVEQVAWNVLACDSGVAYLPEEEYHIEERVHKDTIMKHFTGPRRFEFFLDGIPELVNALQ